MAILKQFFSLIIEANDPEVFPVPHQRIIAHGYTGM
jgi:hypothetical protein